VVCGPWRAARRGGPLRAGRVCLRGRREGLPGPPGRLRRGAGHRLAPLCLVRTGSSGGRPGSTASVAGATCCGLRVWSWPTCRRWPRGRVGRARAARLVDQEVAGLVTIGVEEAVELRLQLSRSRGRVGSHSVEILLSVVMRQVVIGSLAGALSQTEVARHHDAGPTRAPSAGPRPPSGDPLDQRLEPEGRRDPALSRGRHPFEGRRREPAEQKTGPAGRKRRHRPAHTAHLTVPHPGASSTASRPRPRPACAGEGHLPHSPAATHQTVVSSSTRSVRSCRPGRGTSPGSWEG
jgi:hypothetical protein